MGPTHRKSPMYSRREATYTPFAKNREPAMCLC